MQDYSTIKVITNAIKYQQCKRRQVAIQQVELIVEGIRTKKVVKK